MDFGATRHVVEIGAGFGRTAQAVLKLVPHLERYTIIDLPQITALSSRYLRKVLSEAEYSKILFVNALSMRLPESVTHVADLVINIDSFQEIPADTVRFYMQHIVSRCAWFFSKNAVGKYRPESVGLYGLDEKNLLDVFQLGLSTEVIDIFVPRSLEAARRKHVEAYRPADSFRVAATEPLGMFPYYLNVLYARDLLK